MPASYGEYRETFSDLVGTDDAQRTWYNEYTGNWLEWANLFESTGIDFDSSEDTLNAFEDFLITFYPAERSMSADDWAEMRQQFFDMYDIDEHNIDWEAWREAIGY